MLWVYDAAITKDLQDSFTHPYDGTSIVKVVPPEDIINIAAQLQDDKIHFPLVALSREDNISINSSLMNFSRLHSGVLTVFDKKKNELYYERCMPISLQYNLVCLGTNTADIDELIRELIFKYTSQYFITIQVPYESKRKIRCGLRIDPSESIDWYSTSSNYLQEGKLHSAGIKLHVDGAVYLSYTPVKLRRLETDVDIEDPQNNS